MSVKILTEGFESKYFYILKEDAIRQITSILSNLNEAEMSDEDREETRILRQILDKAMDASYDRRKALKYTPRELEVADKYNLTLPAKVKKWDGTTITSLSDKDVDTPRGTGRDRYTPSLSRDIEKSGIRNSRQANLANFIRARKEKGPRNERPYSQIDKFARVDDASTFGDTTFTHDNSGRFGRDRWDEEHGRAPTLAGGRSRTPSGRWIRDKEKDLTDVEKDRIAVNKQMSQPVNDMKKALSDRKENQKDLDNVNLNYARNVANARRRFDDDMAYAEERRKKESESGRQGVDDANNRINKLLKKESLEEDEVDYSDWKYGDPYAPEDPDDYVPFDEELDIDPSKLEDIVDVYNSSRPISGSWDTETAHEQRAISKELGISMEEAKQVMIDQLGFTEEMFTETFSTRLRNKINSLNEAEMSDEDKHDTDILKQIYQKTQGRANAALTPEEKSVLQKYNLERVPYMKNIRSSEGSYRTPIFDDRDFQSSYDWNSGKRIPPKSNKINYADRARKRPERDAQTYDMRDRDFWDMPTPDYERQHEVDSDDYKPATYQQRQRYSDNQKMTQNVRDMTRALRDRKVSQAKIDSADAEHQAELDKLKKEYEDRLAAVKRSQQYRTDSDRRQVDYANKRINKLLRKEEE